MPRIALLLMAWATLVAAPALAEQPPAAGEARPAASDVPPDAGSNAGAAHSDRLLDLYRRNAEAYQFLRGSTEADLRPAPVYSWTNPARNSGQDGAVFVWTIKERPHVLGCIFSHEDQGRLKINHEFHTLSPEVLTVRYSGVGTWQPRAGLSLTPLPGASQPAERSRLRLLQLRALARQFQAKSLHPVTKERWQLRLLPQPLYRYHNPDTGVVQGALLAFVSTAGTDPEVLLLLEAVDTPSGPQWCYSVARFSDLNLFVEHDGREVWSAKRSAEDTWEHDAEHRYRLFLGVEYVDLPSDTSP